MGSMAARGEGCGVAVARGSGLRWLGRAIEAPGKCGFVGEAAALRLSSVGSSMRNVECAAGEGRSCCWLVHAETLSSSDGSSSANLSRLFAVRRAGGSKRWSSSDVRRSAFETAKGSRNK
eukprot:2630992-Rhodomonas_salina.5